MQEISRIKQHPRKLLFAKQEKLVKLLVEMQQNDIIEPSMNYYQFVWIWIYTNYEEYSYRSV